MRASDDSRLSTYNLISNQILGSVQEVRCPALLRGGFYLMGRRLTAGRGQLLSRSLYLWSFNSRLGLARAGEDRARRSRFVGAPALRPRRRCVRGLRLRRGDQRSSGVRRKEWCGKKAACGGWLGLSRCQRSTCPAFPTLCLPFSHSVVPIEVIVDTSGHHAGDDEIRA